MTTGSTAHTPVIPSQPQVLAMMVDLIADLDWLTVDEIDGEFYWRCCRADLAAPIAAFHDSYSVPALGSPNDSRSQFAYLAAVFRFADAARRLRYELLEGYPQIILDHLVAGNRVAMRVPEVAVHFDINKGVSYRMAVYSGSWTGADVEHAFMTAALARRLARLHTRVAAECSACRAVPPIVILHGDEPDPPPSCPQCGRLVTGMTIVRLVRVEWGPQ